jgi:hypothetical protein
VSAFWQPVFDDRQPPFLIFSSMDMAGSALTGLYMYDVGRHAPETRNDTYTGVGEVVAASKITNLFWSAGHEVQVRRAHTFSWEEARSRNLIFLGSALANTPQKEALAPGKFMFQTISRASSGPAVAIVNVDARTGEQAAYFASANRPYTEDHALVRSWSTTNPSRRILLLAGCTTFGTQAAAEFVSAPAELRRLREKLGGKRIFDSDFEALLRVKIAGGVPIGTELLLVHSRQGEKR